MYKNLSKNYIFKFVAEEVKKYKEKTGKTPISLGIGDAMFPIPNTVKTAMENACLELNTVKGFRGYPSVEGCDFLIDKIINFYREKSVKLDKNEVFVSDGAKSDLQRLLLIFENGKKAVIPTPVYPVYEDLLKLYGFKYEYLYANESNCFLPTEIPKCDILFLCNPSNPTGATYSKKQLEKIIDTAIKNGTVILYDNAYSCFLKGNILETVYSIKNAKKCVIEINSFSKSCSFTGIRCGFTVIPKELKEYNERFKRVLSSVFNGVSYITQRGAEKIFSTEGKEFVKTSSKIILNNAKLIKNAVKSSGGVCFGGNSPYVFAKCPNGLTSKEFFNILLYEKGLVCTPGEGFSTGGENFVRFSAFLSENDCKTATQRLKEIYKKYKGN